MRHTKHPRFEKRHYEFIAEILKATGPFEVDSAAAMRNRIIRDLANRFVADNARFDYARFVEACAIGPER